ncbi:hypothetical protein [Rhizobium sp. BK619]|uniref:hypothetical protein n=1 Tax=Rhizobium sp. BK619 TaxID=2586989 RepID=UPI0032B235E2
MPKLAQLQNVRGKSRLRLNSAECEKKRSQLNCLVPRRFRTTVAVVIPSVEPSSYYGHAFDDRGQTCEDLLKMTADDFWEIGASGKAYDRNFVIESLLEFYKGPEPEGWLCSDFTIRLLADGLYQLNYILQQPDLRTR